MAFLQTIKTEKEKEACVLNLWFIHREKCINMQGYNMKGVSEKTGAILEDKFLDEKGCINVLGNL